MQQQTYTRGKRVGPYEIISLMPSGEGGMGAVYLARPRPKYAAGSPPLVALKMAYGAHNDFLKYEVEHMERLSHPHVLRVLPIPSLVTSHGQPLFTAKVDDSPGSPYYIAVEYMRGGSVDHLLKLRGRLTPAEAVEIACQVADALIHIHSRQIVHLDIKDSNILLKEPLPRLGARVPHVIISDFGIAWSTTRKQLGTVYGSHFYTAPERAAGAPPHPQNDIFSLGALLYQMLVGRTPFTSVVVPGTQITEQSRPSVLNPAVSAELERVVLRALATDPTQRYVTVQQMKDDLDRLPGIARPAPVRVPLIQGTREWLITGLSAAATALVAIIIAVMVASLAPSVASPSAPTPPPAATAAPITAEPVVVATAVPPAPTVTPARATATSEPTAAGSRPTSTTLPASRPTAARSPAVQPVLTATPRP